MNRFLFFILFCLVTHSTWGAAVWSPPRLLLNTQGTKKDFAVSINAAGAAVMAWHNQEKEQIEIARYDLIHDVLHSPQLALKGNSQAELLKLILADNQDIYVLWLDKEENSLKVSHYSSSKVEWSETLNVKRANATAQPLIKIDSHGNAMAMWKQWDGIEYRIQAAYFSIQKNKWSSPSTVSPVGYGCSKPAFAFDSLGNAVAMWKAEAFAHHKDNENIQVICFNAQAQAWSNALFFFEDMGKYQPIDIDVIFDSQDVCIMLWNSQHMQNPSSTQFQFVTFDSIQEKWGNQTVIAQEGVLKPKLLNNFSNVYALWQSASGEQNQLKCQRLCYPSSSLSEQVMIPIHLDSLSDYQVKTDCVGKITLAAAGDAYIQITQMMGTEWEQAALFSDQKEAKNMQLAGDALGNSILTWERENQVFYSKGDYLLPPSYFTVKLIEKRYTAKRILRALLSWSNAQNPSVSFYRIRRNKEIIAEVPASQTQFIDKFFHLYHPGNTVYHISSVTEGNLESQSAEYSVNIF